LISAKIYLSKQKDHLGSIKSYCNKVIDPMSIEQLNWKPEAKKWSVGQIMQHLIKLNEAYMQPVKDNLSSIDELDLDSERMYKNGYIGTFLISLMGPESNIKLKSSEVFLPQDDPIEAELKEEFCHSIKSVNDLIDDVNGVDLAELKINVPGNKLMRIRLGDAIKLIVEHMQRHVNQMNSLIESDTFPPKQ